MKQQSIGNVISPVLEDREFQILGGYITSNIGIKLPESKRTLLQCRLQKRLKELKYTSFKDYVSYFLSPQGQHHELNHLINAISTHKTDFFREPLHFEFLESIGLAHYISMYGKNRLSVWSAGCSTGEEPYTLAIMLNEFCSTASQATDFTILATDVSEGVLHHAVEGIYDEKKVTGIPHHLRMKYLMRGKNAYANTVKVVPELQRKIEFRQHNLLARSYAAFGKFDIIFCRNVMIYFEKEVQHRLLRQFSNSLHEGGFLFLGHSESILGLDDLPLKQVKPTIFLRT